MLDLSFSPYTGRRCPKGLNGYEFIRPMPIGPYFADFACREANLVVEVDGSQHAHDTRDAHRDETMNRNGWSVIRVWHIDVLQQRKQVLDTIVAVLDGRLDSKTIALGLKFLPAHSNEDHL